MRRVLLLAVWMNWSLSVVGASTTIYYNEAQWQAALNASGANPLINVSFDNASWTSAFHASSTFNSLTSQSVLGNGQTISAVSGYDPLGVANNALLGQAANGEWADTISKYGNTQFNFSSPIYGFGGTFDISGSNGLEIFPGTSTAFASPTGIYDGFIGVVSNQALNSILITWGQNGNCTQCFGNSYTLNNLQLASAAVPKATPEPNYSYPLAGLLLFGIGIAKRRRSR